MDLDRATRANSLDVSDLSDGVIDELADREEQIGPHL
jgi:hypothetical protein